MKETFREYVTNKFYDCNRNKVKYYNEEPYGSVLEYFKANKHFLINKFKARKT